MPPREDDEVLTPGNLRPGIEAVRDEDAGSGPPLMLSVSFLVAPGNDLDRCDQVVAALDDAYASLREAVLHQRSGNGAAVVREFWLAHKGQAFQVTAAVAVAP